ncbi:MAG: twin-arginine translocation signal domain-containing protein, partial [Planctomycetota bacterium]
MKPDKETMTRRRFLKASTQVTALAGFSIATQAHGANNYRIRVGLVGCGGRGTGAARDVLVAGPNIELVAMCDIFKAKVENSLARLKRIQ